LAGRREAGKEERRKTWKVKRPKKKEKEKRKKKRRKKNGKKWNSIQEPYPGFVLEHSRGRGTLLSAYLCNHFFTKLS
jgi:hypothetical protein